MSLHPLSLALSLYFSLSLSLSTSFSPFLPLSHCTPCTGLLNLHLMRIILNISISLALPFRLFLHFYVSPKHIHSLSLCLSLSIYLCTSPTNRTFDRPSSVPIALHSSTHLFVHLAIQSSVCASVLASLQHFAPPSARFALLPVFFLPTLWPSVHPSLHAAFCACVLIIAAVENLLHCRIDILVTFTNF